ncbi:hypothetical protein BD309DRAFT_974583 [Dichomitus squalens]|uniref:Uncharacterized protein n=1 Tax=Dichomitus squalens TaxID=114155 RepID=A0A4Q9N8S0_9APHY|nr:hypothetical protein BD309DRAFT_974583 [Dichomitus squalens]TBU51344.1 hypothetical protein BD310DRAFT_942326 [Dichomitus squalens]
MTKNTARRIMWGKLKGSVDPCLHHPNARPRHSFAFNLCIGSLDGAIGWLRVFALF